MNDNKMGEIGGLNSKVSVNTEDEHSGLGLRWKCYPPPDPASITEECFSAAEEAAEQVLNCVHPSLDSEEERRDVIDYIQQLIKHHLSCEVVSYGSVPLKTYLPDGDIDLTVLKGPTAEESMAHDVLALLEDEEHNENAEYQVMDTHFIDAEVKLVKCLIRNIIIDISFNQLGGLSTLCFLEQVDRFIARDHLFKRSIILVKTWCYYESRILGAHHGLISTYALEILVLYIINHFHSSLSGPLSVLYKFLDYYSQFDWEKYCISLSGPVCKSSQPDIVARMPENGSNNLLLNKSFLENCMEMFSVSSRELEANTKGFQMKHLNIIDPLKENNNLGRSVNRGNFYRIQSALKYGAYKLGQSLLRPLDKVAYEIHEFFANTLGRHQHQYRYNSLRLDQEFDDEGSAATSLSPHRGFCSKDDYFLLNSFVDEFDYDSVGFEEVDRYSIREASPKMASETSCSADGASTSSLRNGTSDYNTMSSTCSALEYHFKSSDEKGSSGSAQIDSSINDTHQWCLENSEVKDPSFDSRKEIDSTSTGGESEAFNPLADLNGDYDSHIRNLLCGQFCYGFGLSSSLSKNEDKRPWDIVRQSMPLTENKVCKIGGDSGVLGTWFQLEGRQKARGTGTYFPNMNVYQTERSSYGRGRNRVNHNYLRRTKSFENSSHEVPHSRRRRKPLDVLHESTRSSQINGYSSSLCRIQFGSIGNLADEVISSSTRKSFLKAQDSPGMVMQDRVSGPSIHLKNEDEFPPLCH